MELKNQQPKSHACKWNILPGFHCFKSQISESVESTQVSELEEKTNGHSKRKHRGWKSMPFIFGNEICEKLAAIGFGANMITYLTQQLHMEAAKASTTLTNFGGTASLAPLLGAFLADAYVGRFWTITVCSVIYAMGMALLTFTTVIPSLKPRPCSHLNAICSPPSTNQLVALYMSFLLTTLGSAGIRPCVAAFGADQFDQKDVRQGKKLKNFFNWYYFCMGLASLLAVTVIVYVQENVGWTLGFGIPAITMLFSVVFFVLGMPLYIYVSPTGSPFTRLARVLVAAFKKRKLDLPANIEYSLYELPEKERSSNSNSRLRHTQQFTWLDRAAVEAEEDVRAMEEKGEVNPWRLCTVTEVEELKSLVRMGPIWAAGILLITASAQQGTWSVLQARTLNRHLTHSFQIPAGSMTVFSTAALLITIPLYDRLLMPLARRFTGHPRGITFLQRMGIGFFLSTIATLAAGFVEKKRKHVAQLHRLLDLPKSTLPMSVFWLLPQYSLHGVAEAFMSIGHLEFFYDQSPESMRSTATALFWTSISAGNYLSSFLVSFIHKTTGSSRDQYSQWLPNNINRGHLDYFFWLLTGLQFLNLVFFIISARWYKYKSVHEDEKEKDGDRELKINEASISDV